MLKMTALIVRLSSLTKQAFEKHHRDVHAPQFAANRAAQKHVKRYVLSYPTEVQPPGLARTPCDAIVEFWFDGVAAMMATFVHPHYLPKLRPDEHRFMDMERSSFIVTRENVVIQHDPDFLSAVNPSPSRTGRSELRRKRQSHADSFVGTPLTAMAICSSPLTSRVRR